MIYTEILDSDKELLKTNTCAIKTKIIVKEISSLDTQSIADEEVGNLFEVLTEDDYIKDWLYTEERYVPDNGFIGQFVARTLSGNFQDVSEEFTLENKAIELRLAIVNLKGTEQTENWYSLGTFNVTKPENDDVTDNTTFEAMDNTILFNKSFNYDYIDTEYEKSFKTLCEEGTGMTALELAKYTCKQVGVTFGSESFTNDDFQIISNQFVSDDSCRDVMKAIAQLAYSWVYIDWDDKCYIPLINFDSESVDEYDIITPDEYFSLTLQKEMYGPVNNVRIGMSAVTNTAPVQADDETSITEYGETLIEINDNPITYNDNIREEAIKKATVLWGLIYNPLETETIGHPWFKAHKTICVEDTSGYKRYTLPLNLEINYTGHIRTTITSIADTKSEQENGYNKTVYKDLKNLYITIDKQNGTIESLNQKVTATEDGLGSLTTEVRSMTTDTYTRTEINKIISGTSPDGTVVSSVKTTAGTLDDNGLTIEQTDAETKTNINADGMIIYDATGGLDDSLLTVNSTGMIAKNARIDTYLNIGQHSRLEDYTHTDYTEGTGVFWIGGD